MKKKVRVMSEYISAEDKNKKKILRTKSVKNETMISEVTELNNLENEEIFSCEKSQIKLQFLSKGVGKFVREQVRLPSLSRSTDENTEITKIKFGV